MSLLEDGFEHLPNHASMETAEALASSVEQCLGSSGERMLAGVRNLLASSPTVRELATLGALAVVARQHLGPAAFPVRGILFDKSPSANWLVPFHQDISIPVRNRVDVPGYGPWSIKHGVQHVQPPSAVLEQMLTLRLHLDDAGESNGPLLVYPGSHANGILEEQRIVSLQQDSKPFACLSRRGDLLLMRPLLVHGSPKATHPRRRRVLHIEYAAEPLPPPLEWARS